MRDIYDDMGIQTVRNMRREFFYKCKYVRQSDESIERSVLDRERYLNEAAKILEILLKMGCGAFVVGDRFSEEKRDEELMILRDVMERVSARRKELN